MSAARRERGGRRGRPDRFDRREGMGIPGRGQRGKPVPQYSEEQLKAAAKAAVSDILKNEPPEKVIGRLSSMGINNKVASIIYSHARDQVRMARRRMVALLMAVGIFCMVIGLIVTTVQLWPAENEPWKVPWAGLIIVVVAMILMVFGYWRWRVHIRS